MLLKHRSLVLIALCLALAVVPAGCDGNAATSTSSSPNATDATAPDGVENTGEWIEMNPAGNLPAKRALHSMVYASAHDSVILFGGTDSTAFFADTWKYDLAADTWTDLQPAGALPPGRCAAAMVYASSIDKVILFGGTDGETLFADTWEYDPASNTWTEITPAGSAPAARMGHGMVYDTANERLRLFGGKSDESFFADMWAFNAGDNNWTLVEPVTDAPSARSGHAMIYDPAGQKVIVFAGWDGDAYFNSTWVYDPEENSWTSLNTLGKSPPRAVNNSAVYEAASARIVFFGGMNPSGSRDDLRAYYPGSNTWTVLTPTGAEPVARNSHSMVYDSTAGKALLFGGWDGSEYFNDTWSLDDAN